MDNARLTELPLVRVVRRWYRGPRPPAPAFFAHWRDFNTWAKQHGIASAEPATVMAGYEPPGTPGRHDFEYAACIPVAGGLALPDDTAELGWLPGGRYVLATGDLGELPELYKAAKRFAFSQGLPFERGGIELFHRHPTDPAGYRVDAGCRIHD